VECEQWLVAVKQVVSKAVAEANVEIQTGYTGRPVFVAEIARGMQQDMKFSIVGTAAIIAVLF
jgi:hypothetical protein